MATNVRHVNVPTKVGMRSVAANVGRFLWHLLQMVLAMMVYHLLLGTVLAGTGYAALTQHTTQDVAAAHEENHKERAYHTA